MNQELVEKWLAALRSGKYQQGTQHLCSIENGQKNYCCLGVLLDVANIKGRTSVGYIDNVMDFNGDTATLTNNRLLPSEDGGFRPHDLSITGQNFCYNLLSKYNIRISYMVTCLTEINDAGASFDEIAKLIEYIVESNAWERTHDEQF